MVEWIWAQEPSKKKKEHQQFMNLVLLKPSIQFTQGELEYEFSSESYDLGLVDESELSQISDAPGEDYRSYTELDGVAGIHYSPFGKLVCMACYLFSTDGNSPF